MNRTQRLQAAERVRLSLTHRLTDLGFTRGKTSWWYRIHQQHAELIHLLLDRGQDRFRIHSAIRVLNDPFPAVDLNGPVSHADDPEYLGFGDADEEMRECVDECMAYVTRVLIPWFATWDVNAILRHSHPPVAVRASDALLDALAGRGDPEREHRSRKLFGAPTKKEPPKKDPQNEEA